MKEFLIRENNFGGVKWLSLSGSMLSLLPFFFNF